MKGEVKRQGSFLAGPIYDHVIPADHFLRRLLSIIDWEALAAELEDCYSDEGRPSWPPEQMLKISILQFLYDRSDREIADDLRYHLAYKFFLGLEVDGLGPDNSSISRFRSRLGAERFGRLFNSVVAAARARKLVSDRLHAVDATAVEAKVNTWRWRDGSADETSRPPEPPAVSGEPDSRHESAEVAPPSSGSDDPPDDSGGMVKWEGPCLSSGPDRDACFGYKSKTKPFHGYKAHVAVDVQEGIIVGVVTTPGNESDGEVLADVLDERAEALVADKAYDTPDNHKLLRKNKIADRIIRKSRAGPEGESQAEARLQRGVVERVNAWLKRWNGGGRARYWGLERVSMQMLLAAMAVNLKRMVVCLSASP